MSKGRNITLNGPTYNAHKNAPPQIRLKVSMSDINKEAIRIASLISISRWYQKGMGGIPDSTTHLSVRNAKTTDPCRQTYPAADNSMT